MIIRSATFLGSSPDLASCKPSDLPEFALIGRSNVGKSSLVNMLTRVGDLAKVSATPGKTRLINFFAINKSWTLVDLPGYGHAKVSQEERVRFYSSISDYLQNRPNLLMTFVLIDSAIPPQQIDLDFLSWMADCEKPFSLIFTKTDRRSRTATQANIDAFLARLQEISDEPCPHLASSAKLSHGRAEILKLISGILEGRGEAMA